ncbi:hypothetical protein D3C84_533250 [compost metagenome]
MINDWSYFLQVRGDLVLANLRIDLAIHCARCARESFLNHFGGSLSCSSHSLASRSIQHFAKSFNCSFAACSNCSDLIFRDRASEVNLGKCLRHAFLIELEDIRRIKLWRCSLNLRRSFPYLSKGIQRGNLRSWIWSNFGWVSTWSWRLKLLAIRSLLRLLQLVSWSVCSSWTEEVHYAFECHDSYSLTLGKDVTGKNRFDFVAPTFESVQSVPG